MLRPDVRPVPAQKQSEGGMSAAKQLLEEEAMLNSARQGIGGNSPPPEAAFSMEIDELFSMVVAAGEVTNEEQDAAMDGLLDDFRKVRKSVDEQRAAEKKPHDDAGKAVQARYKPLLDKADRGADEIKRLLTPYRARVKAEKDAAAAKAREEAEALQKAAQAKLQASDDLEEKFEAEEALKAASKLTAQANRIDRGPKGTVTRWTAHVDDRRAALNALLPKFPERFEALIQQMADEACRSGRPIIPGVRYSSEEVAN